MASCILNTFNFYQCAALKCLLLLPWCSLSWCTSRCNSTESHRLFPASTRLHISPEIQPWTFSSFCPTPDYQKSEESRRAQLTPGTATMPWWQDTSCYEGSASSPTGTMASHQPPMPVGLCAMLLWPLQKLFPALLFFPLCPLGQAAQWLH